jgi:hypothetical protein
MANVPEPVPDEQDHAQHREIHDAPLHTRFLRTGRSRMVDEREVLCALNDAEIIESQLVPWGSNYTFAVALQNNHPEPFLAIYKPEEGAAPLWDFPTGTLYRREYASYLLSRLLGWRFIPPTVVRSGPYGIGTVQLYIEPEKEIRGERGWQRFANELLQVAVFDVVANNADRKPSHFFLGRFQRQLWGIDHGLTFNVAPKLRTVLWEFAGEPIPDDISRRLERIERHQDRLVQLLEPHLDPDEILMLIVRAEELRRSGRMPVLTSRRNIPYGW